MCVRPGGTGWRWRIGRPRFRWADVQDRCEVHRTFRDAVAGVVGEEAMVRERLGAGLSSLHVARRVYRLDYPFPAC